MLTSNSTKQIQGYSVEALRAQTDRILASARFERAGALGRLLRFVVDETLEGHENEIKEYRLGVDVFSRPADYDPRVDPVVRTQAAKLRARLAEYYAEEGRADRIVISMPKGGYLPVFSSAQPPARSSAVSSIAVLPFVNISPDPENEHFSDGLTEELINVLASNSSWAVVSRTSTFAFKNTVQDVREIGAHLKAERIVEGSVRKIGNQLRVTAQLIEVSTGFNLSSRSYTRELSNVFTTQDELANAVAADLVASASQKARPFLVRAQHAA